MPLIYDQRMGLQQPLPRAVANWEKVMKRETWLKGGLVALVSAAALSASQPGYAEDLTVAVFGGRLGETLKTEMIEPFRQQSKLDVVADDRDWGIGIIRTRLEGGSNTWDVVTAEDIEAIQGCQEGLFAPVDKSRLPNLEKYVVGVKDGDCAIPMVLYNTTIAYDKDKIADAPKDWADFWNVEKWPGKRSMFKEPRDSLEAALMADGVAREDVYQVLSTPEGVDRAFKKLDELKPHLLWWNNAGQSRQMLASGEVVMTATYDSGIHNMNLNEKTNFGVSLQDAITHIDHWAIVNDSPQIDNAYAFLEFASRAEPQAGVSNTMGISVPNGDALPLINETMRPLLSGNPDNIKNALTSDTQFWLDNYDALSKRFQAWAAQ
jgi:putative spermidine/putrescine transport system substrate-binding protein